MAKPVWHRSLWSRHVLAGDLRRAHDSNHRRGQRDCGTCCGWRGWHAIGLFYATWAFPDAWRRRADGLSGFADGACSDSLCLERSVYNTILVIGIVYATTTARILYGMTLKLKGEVFVDAAICSGAGHNSILFRHILPNLFRPYWYKPVSSLPLRSYRPQRLIFWAWTTARSAKLGQYAVRRANLYHARPLAADLSWNVDCVVGLFHESCGGRASR